MFFPVVLLVFGFEEVLEKVINPYWYEQGSGEVGSCATAVRHA
jgi:hypothetical protein